MKATRKNDFCVISKKANENGWHDLQTNNGWTNNPCEERFAIVPDEMVEAIKETYGYCNITLNETGTEIVSFEKIPVPLLPTPETKPTKLDEIEAQVMYTAMMTDTLMEV